MASRPAHAHPVRNGESGESGPRPGKRSERGVRNEKGVFLFRKKF
jgi:hypothetical protein